MSSSHPPPLTWNLPCQWKLSVSQKHAFQPRVIILTLSGGPCVSNNGAFPSICQQNHGPRDQRASLPPLAHVPLRALVRRIGHDSKLKSLGSQRKQTQARFARNIRETSKKCRQSACPSPERIPRSSTYITSRLSPRSAKSAFLTTNSGAEAIRTESG